jgi:hypothetical protein
MFAHKLVAHPSSQRALAHMAITLSFHTITILGLVINISF